MGLETPKDRTQERLGNFKENFESLNVGANVTELESPEALKGRQLFRIDVTNQKRWASKKSSEKLLPTFGNIAREIYADRDDEQKYDPQDDEMVETAVESMYNSDLGESKQVFVVVEGDKVVGLLGSEDVKMENGENGCLVDIVCVDRDHTGQGISHELYKNVFAERKYDVVIGVANMPGAVKNRLAVGEEFGYDGFYCGYRNGEFGNQGSAEEQDYIRKTSKETTKMYVDSESTIPAEQIPENYVVVMEEIVPIPPLKQEELKFGPEDAKLQETFEKGLLATQSEIHEKRQPDKDTVYGILINRRRQEMAQ
jgi:hypothetical protein